MNKNNFKNVESFKQIKTLLHLRWYVNTHSLQILSDNIKVDIEKLKIINNLNTRENE